MKSHKSGHSNFPLMFSLNMLNSVTNKKVLLRESKRHTDRGISSTPSVTRGGVSPKSGYPPARSNGEYPRWGTPHQGTPWPGLTGVPKVRYPLSGTPQPHLIGVPLARSNGGTQGGVPQTGYPLPQPGLTGTPQPGLTGGT